MRRILKRWFSIFVIGASLWAPSAESRDARTRLRRQQDWDRPNVDAEAIEWIPYGHCRFAYVDAEKTAAKSNQICGELQWGASLVVIADSSHAKFISGLAGVSAISSARWVGGEYSSQEQAFVPRYEGLWFDGEPSISPTQMHWEEGLTAPVERCVQQGLHNSSTNLWQLNNAKCGVKKPFVCAHCPPTTTTTATAASTASTAGMVPSTSSTEASTTATSSTVTTFTSSVTRTTEKTISASTATAIWPGWYPSDGILQVCETCTFKHFQSAFDYFEHNSTGPPTTIIVASGVDQVVPDNLDVNCAGDSKSLSVVGNAALTFEQGITMTRENECVLISLFNLRLKSENGGKRSGFAINGGYIVDVGVRDCSFHAGNVGKSKHVHLQSQSVSGAILFQGNTFYDGSHPKIIGTSGKGRNSAAEPNIAFRNNHLVNVGGGVLFSGSAAAGRSVSIVGNTYSFNNDIGSNDFRAAFEVSGFKRINFERNTVENIQPNELHHRRAFHVIGSVDVAQHVRFVGNRVVNSNGCAWFQLWPAEEGDGKSSMTTFTDVTGNVCIYDTFGIYLGAEDIGSPGLVNLKGNISPERDATAIAARLLESGTSFTKSLFDYNLEITSAVTSTTSTPLHPLSIPDGGVQATTKSSAIADEKSELCNAGQLACCKGGCFDVSAQSDGMQDCSDGSDENWEWLTCSISRLTDDFQVTQFPATDPTSTSTSSTTTTVSTTTTSSSSTSTSTFSTAATYSAMVSTDSIGTTAAPMISTVTSTSTTTIPTTVKTLHQDLNVDEYSVLNGRGCCRPDGGRSALRVTVLGIPNVQKCAGKCSTAGRDCKAIEFHRRDLKCELHFTVIEQTNTDRYCQCWTKNINFATTAKSTTTTLASTTSTTDAVATTTTQEPTTTTTTKTATLITTSSRTTTASTHTSSTAASKTDTSTTVTTSRTATTQTFTSTTETVTTTTRRTTSSTGYNEYMPVSPLGCCRPEGGFDSPFDTVMGLASIQECADTCSKTGRACKAVEFHIRDNATAPSTPPTPSTPSVVPEITSTSTKVDSEKVWVCIYVDSDDSASAGRATGACELESRVDYYGDDLQDGMQPGNSTSDCAEHCVRRLECSHFTFIWGKCWLKSSSTGREFNSVGVSGECHTDLEVVTSVCANGDASTTATLIGSTAPSTATSVTMATATTATRTAPSTPPTPSTPSVVPEITSTSTK
eukprot:gene5757-14969_t